MPVHRSAWYTCALLLALAACGGSETPPQDDVLPEEPCPQPTGSTTHADDVHADTTWTAAGSPHLVTQKIVIREGATLTIESCAEVRLSEGVALQVGINGEASKLVAVGTAKRPIRFTAAAAGQPWEAVQLIGGSARFEFVTFEDGGRVSPNNRAGATIRALGDLAWPPEPVLTVRDVAIRRSQGVGINLTLNAGFGVGSDRLTVADSGNVDYPFAVSIDAGGLPNFPTVTLTGNEMNEVEVGTGIDMEGNVTIRKIGAPYHVTPYPGDTLTIDSGGVLEIEPGVTLKMGAGMRIRLGTVIIGGGAADGAIRAIGTAAEPIVFTSAAAQPAAGDWVGLFFTGDTTHPANQISHARIEYAGGDCLCAGAGCTPASANYEEAAVIFRHAEPPAQFIQNTVFKASAGHAVLRAWAGADLSFSPTNTFEQIAGCVQTMVRDPDTNACPDPIACVN